MKRKNLMLLVVGVVLVGTLVGCNKDTKENDTKVTEATEVTETTEVTEATTEEVTEATTEEITEVTESMLDISSYAYVPTYAIEGTDMVYEVGWNGTGADEATDSTQPVIVRKDSETINLGPIGDGNFSYISLPNMGIGFPMLNELATFEGDTYSDGNGLVDMESYEMGITYSISTSKDKLNCLNPDWNGGGHFNAYTDSFDGGTFEQLQTESDETLAKLALNQSDYLTYTGEIERQVDADGNFRVLIGVDSTYGKGELIGYSLMIVTPEMNNVHVTICMYTGNTSLSHVVPKALIQNVVMLKPNN